MFLLHGLTNTRARGPRAEAEYLEPILVQFKQRLQSEPNYTVLDILLNCAIF